jgi:hypothetical protein
MGLLYANQGNVYATVLDWKVVLSLKALHIDGRTLGKVSKVELLGSGLTLIYAR